MCDVWEKFEALLIICWRCTTVAFFWILHCYENGHLLIICVNMSFALFWDMVVTIVVFIEKEWEHKEDVLFSRVVSRAAMDIIFRGTYRAPRRLLLTMVVSCAATDAWTDMSPMDPELKDSGCVSLRKICITIFDIESHGIANFIIDELEHMFC